MQGKTMVRSPHVYENGYYQKNQELTRGVRGVKKRGALYTVGGNINWYGHHKKQCGDSL